MKKYLAALSTTALMSFAPFALAASSTDLTVTGFITPSACTPGLSGGGNIDLGKIPVKDLNPDPDRFTRLEPQPIQFSMTCNSPTFFALDPIDNKAGTSWREPDGFGLGLTDAGEQVGHFWIYALNPQADGQPVATTVSTDGGANWANGEWIGKGYLTSVSALGNPLPLAATNVAWVFEIIPIIAPKNSLTLTDQVTIDGSVTIDVKYL